MRIVETLASDLNPHLMQDYGRIYRMSGITEETVKLQHEASEVKNAFMAVSSSFPPERRADVQRVAAITHSAMGIWF